MQLNCLDFTSSRVPQDVRAEVLTGEDRGFKLKFFFKENPFFTNAVGTGVTMCNRLRVSLEHVLTIKWSIQVLEKTYIMEPEDDIVPKEFIGCKIEWKEGKDVTMEQVKLSIIPHPRDFVHANRSSIASQVKKRVKGGKGGEDKKAKAFVTESVPCDSFFNTFDPPKIPKNPDDMSDEQMDELQEALTVDFDIGYAIKVRL